MDRTQALAAMQALDDWIHVLHLELEVAEEDGSTEYVMNLPNVISRMVHELQQLSRVASYILERLPADSPAEDGEPTT